MCLFAYIDITASVSFLHTYMCCILKIRMNLHSRPNLWTHIDENIYISILKQYIYIYTLYVLYKHMLVWVNSSAQFHPRTINLPSTYKLYMNVPWWKAWTPSLYHDGNTAPDALITPRCPLYDARWRFISGCCTRWKGRPWWWMLQRGGGADICFIL